MLDTILTILLVFFGIVTGMVSTLPLFLGMFDSQSHYLPFGIGTAVGVIGAFVLAYALTFHT